MASNLSLNSTDSDVFYVEQSSNDQSIPRPNTPIVLNSTEISGDDTREMIAWTTNCDNRWRLKWAHDDIRFWTAAPDCSPKPERLESAAQVL